MRVLVLEGSAEEVTEVLNNAHVMQTSGVAISTAVASAADTADNEGGEKVFVTEEVARRVFTRRPLSKQQKTLLKELFKAFPGWIAATQLQKAVGYSPAQFAGLMGAFGRRFSHTEGFVSGSWLFDADWDYDAGCYNYRLPETVLAALEAEGIATL